MGAVRTTESAGCLNEEQARQEQQSLLSLNAHPEQPSSQAERSSTYAPPSPPPSYSSLAHCPQRLLGGRGLSSLHLSTHPPSPSTASVSRPFKYLYGRTIHDLRSVTDSDTLIEWSHSHSPHLRRTTRLRRIGAEVVREEWAWVEEGWRLEKVERELFGGEEGAERWVTWEGHEVADRYDEGLVGSRFSTFVSLTVYIGRIMAERTSPRSSLT